MTNLQLYIAICVPIVFNSALFGAMALHMNSKFKALNGRFDSLFKRLDQDLL
jgi:hypothetical protein